MQAAGVWLFSGGLQAASSARVLRQKNGEVIVTDEPFIESKEMSGGIMIIAVPDIDSALMWARKAAVATTTAIEVRRF